MPPKKRKGKQTPPSTRATRRSARSRTNSTPEKVKKEKAKAEVKKEEKVEDVDVDVISARYCVFLNCRDLPSERLQVVIFDHFASPWFH